MSKFINWSTHPENQITFTQKLLSYLSLSIREAQFQIFWRHFNPERDYKVLDVGVRSDETLVDSNFFERRYPFPEKLTAVSVENVSRLAKKYPKISFRRVMADKKMPFVDKSFDLVVSWATVEHVGTRAQQQFFLEELFRIGKKVFITTPNKRFIYEPHSGLFFVHWLEHKSFSKISVFLGKKFWAEINNFNPLGIEEVKKILPDKKGVKIIKFKSMGLFTTHLIIVKP